MSHLAEVTAGPGIDRYLAHQPPPLSAENMLGVANLGLLPLVPILSDR
jgi:hypothetical protein